jgi:hypothetical protein
MALEHCTHCQATDRNTAGESCKDSPTGRHEWIATTDTRGHSTPTPGGSEPFTADTGTGKK